MPVQEDLIKNVVAWHLMSVFEHTAAWYASLYEVKTCNICNGQYAVQL